MSQQYDFSDIAPVDDSQFKEKMKVLVTEPGFEDAVRYILPDVDFPDLVNHLLQIPDKEYLQTKIMYPILEKLARTTTSGITASGLDHIKKEESCTFISNHRDIVLDASFLNLCLIRAGYRTSQIAIGDNLLIYDWITDLVKINKSFIVKRNLRAMQALEAARKLSAYIHYAISTEHESVWIAQREGRAKDSNDLTQESLIKMLALSGEGTLARRLMEINLVPVSISYEYDPNDYLKALEFLYKRENPAYKKSPGDDLKAMETGLLSHKGRVHFEIGYSINPALEPMAEMTDKLKVVKNVCNNIDRQIHLGYHIFPVNFIAYDLLEVTDRHRDRYTTEEFLAFRDYVESQLDKVNIPDYTPDRRGFMYRKMLEMYANPLRNKLKAEATSPVNFK